MPVPAGALNILVAVGAVEAAGRLYGYETFVAPATVQVTPASHVGVPGDEVIVVAPAGSE